MRDRATFGYLEPATRNPKFAQCGTCRLWLEGTQRCLWLQPDDEVQSGDSCIFYVEGAPPGQEELVPIRALTTSEVGLVRGDVRCENCMSFDKKASACELFRKLNKELPKQFKLDARVKAHACCNAFDSDKIEKLY